MMKPAACPVHHTVFLGARKLGTEGTGIVPNWDLIMNYVVGS